MVKCIIIDGRNQGIVLTEKHEIGIIKQKRETKAVELDEKSRKSEKGD